MYSWSQICKLMGYAKTQTEMDYQRSIIDIVLEMGLGWHTEQISEQYCLHLGSTERLVPDILVTKDIQNKFIIEVKKPSLVKTQRDIDQLTSYMKQLETPIGIYWGKEVEVYFKNLGDGSQPFRLMTLHFNLSDNNGEEFVRLFSEAAFSITTISEFKSHQESKIVFETNVACLVETITSSKFHDDLIQLIVSHFIEKGIDSKVITTALDQIQISTYKKSTPYEINEPTPIKDNPVHNVPHRGRKGNNQGVAQRYAYNLVKQIIDNNPSLTFRQLFAIFGKKNYIEDITQVRDEKRWCMDSEDIVTVADSTKIVISNQWGFNGFSQAKMDYLRAIAKEYGIAESLPYS